MKKHEKIVRLLDARGWNNATFARWMGFGESKASKVQKGQLQLTIPESIRFAREFGVSLEYLLDDAMDEPEKGLSRDDIVILEIVDSLGYDAARKRLLNVPEGEVRAGQSADDAVRTRELVRDTGMPGSAPKSPHRKRQG